MTAISITCPFCDSKMNAPAKAAGRQVKCPRCEMDFTVQDSGEQQPSAPAVPPKRTPYTGSKHTESAFYKAGKSIGSQLPSAEFYFTDLAATAAQALSVVSGVACVIIFGVALNGGLIAQALPFLAGAFSCAWFFAMAGAVRAVVHIARRA